MISEREIQLTVLVVKQGRVVERSLLTTKPGAAGLGDHMFSKRGSRPILVWRELGAAVGEHSDGAPPLTVTELYDVCEREVLGKHAPLQPRLYFHRRGTLQHCGYLPEECPDCPSVSIQVVGDFVPKPHQRPAHYLCTDCYGVVLPRNAPLRTHKCEICTCEAVYSQDPRARMQAPGTAPDHGADELCKLAPEDCQSPELPDGLADICQIDPAACPQPRYLTDEAPRARFSCKYLLSADCSGGGAIEPLKPACVGSPTPHESQEEYARRCLQRQSR